MLVLMTPESQKRESRKYFPHSFDMFSLLLVVILNWNIIHGNKNVIRFDEDFFKNLEISSTIESYDELALLDRYQCAIECFKDKDICNGYSFDLTTNLCSLYNDPTRTIHNRLIELVKYRKEKSI